MNRNSIANRQRLGCASNPATVSSRALTLVDVLVTIAVVVLLIATLAPVLPRARQEAGQVTSMNNLSTLAGAHALYAADWNDRQVTWVPDEVGLLVPGEPVCQNLLQTGGCPPQFHLGWDNNPTPTAWGYFLGCAGFPGNCGNWVIYEPCSFTPVANGVGAFRLPNAQAFHNYVDGRFYDETFYAPNDKLVYNAVIPLFEEAASFFDPPGQASIWNSSYCLSPAAMWSPQVLALNPLNGKHYTPPNQLDNGYVSPTVSQCAYPDLKTRMMEHNWTLGAPAATNPAFAGNMTPYYFNHGLDATPLTLFFDGHIDALPNSQPVEDDLSVLLAGGPGLWSRDTPLGADGYFGAQSYDGTIVSHHILTIDGILGRDVLDAAPDGAGGLAEAGASSRKSAPSTKAAVTKRQRRPAPITPPERLFGAPEGIPIQ